MALMAMGACDSSTAEMLTGSGDLVTREESVSNFSRVQAGHSFQIEIARSAAYSVVVTADNNIIDRVEVSKNGDRLVLDLEGGLNVRNATLRATITMPQLTGLDISGASRVEVTDFRSSDDLVVALSGVSRLDGDIGAGDVSFTLSGASRLELEGSAKDIRLDVGGASNVDLKDFPVDDARVKLSGASHATLDVRKTLGPADLSGASSLVYHGDPSIKDLNASGGSTIRPG